jgi:hypothetical protein
MKVSTQCLPFYSLSSRDLSDQRILSGYVWKSREKAKYQVKNHFCLGDSRQNDPDRDPPHLGLANEALLPPDTAGTPLL